MTLVALDQINALLSFSAFIFFFFFASPRFPSLKRTSVSYGETPSIFVDQALDFVYFSFLFLFTFFVFSNDFDYFRLLTIRYQIDGFI